MNGATVFQMVAGLGDAFGNAYSDARREAQEAEAPGLLTNLMQAYRGGAPAPAAPALDAPASAPASGGPKLPTFAQGTDIGRYASAIQANESSGNYRAIGPTHPKYGRALGAYQVMESNLPSWSREAVGREVSPDEFLGSPQIQDAIFRTKFGQSVAKYGNPQDAASVWFTGRPLAQGANAKDVLGTTGAEYVRRFNAGLGRAPAGAAPALPTTAMRMPGATEVRPAPAQTAAADAPAPGAMPVGFTVPEGASQGAVSVPAPSAAGFGGGRPQLTEELKAALNAAWRNPNTRGVAAQVFGQLLKGRDSPWELKEVNGQSAWVNGQTREVLNIGERKVDPTPDERNFQRSLDDPRFQQFLDAQRRPLTPTIAKPGDTVLPPGEYSTPSLVVPDRDKSADSEAKLRGEFTKNLGTFNDVQDAYGRVIAAVQNREADPKAVSPASDIALVFGYMKMLDPTSVVREGEYATAKNATGVPEQVLNTYNKLLQGEFLSPDQRQDFVDTAGRVYGQARQAAEGTATRYRDLARGQGLDEGRVVALPGALTAPRVAPKKPDPAAAEPAPVARPKRVEGGRPPEGYTWESYLARAQKMAKERPDLRPQIEEMLANAGIAPEKLGR